MPHAIIVVGNERRYIDNSLAFARYLHKEVSCPISVIRGAYLTTGQLGARLRKAVRRAKGKPLIVAYFGHGLPDHWSFALESQNDPIRFPFKALSDILAGHDGPLAIVNDTCHAEGLKPFLEKAGTAERCMLISACAAEDVSYGGLGAGVVARWHEGKPFEPFVERERLCIIKMFRYVPPLRIRLRDRWENLMIRLRNRFVAAERRRPTTIRLHSPPNGAGVREEVTERLVGRRWGAELDHHFFPRKT